MDEPQPTYAEVTPVMEMLGRIVMVAEGPIIDDVNVMSGRTGIDQYLTRWAAIDITIGDERFCIRLEKLA